MSARIDDLIKALDDARGCGCCGAYEDLVKILPCGPACAADEDGYVDHTYGDDCSANFRGALKRAFEAVSR